MKFNHRTSIPHILHPVVHPCLLDLRHREDEVVRPCTCRAMSLRRCRQLLVEAAVTEAAATEVTATEATATEATTTEATTTEATTTEATTVVVANNTTEKEKGYTRCVAMHTFEAGEEDDLGFAEGQIVVVTDKSDDGWWVGYLEDNGPSSKKGHFPSNYVKVEEAAATTQNTVHVEEAEEKEKGTRCVAIHTFEAGEEADLGFVEGQIIIATDMSDKGWWVGYLLDDGPSSKKGHFPSNYVKYGST